MTVVHSVQGNRIVVALKGELDLTTAGPLREALDQLLDRHPGRDLVLDLAEVPFVDSSGLGVILGRYRRVRQEGRQLAIVNPRPHVRAVFDMAGMDTLMSIAPARPPERAGR
ncbi:anti-sigma F factor antagonist (spoIIAA-2); anti sigma b factor antagonist RsbV [Candidatus Hydrogenisulfobacillus filiaventi]|uniref:Anti-sigma factor antagonist n=1 Tax=Candidatus Hydrogenisulfobacillus filiaventi TaxID=2707344 RepID=A0A6F8ZG58_9FIRM|nr:anti-sigma F factor antagonist (spoIIAA-2); anti sigma b factor antagonist RsbV [Candidatus Hydrogenisulfobacillus filiaventi]